KTKEKQQGLAPRRPNGPPGARRCDHLFSFCQAILIQITQRNPSSQGDAQAFLRTNTSAKQDGE
ncbi:hypothetical protein AVEN_265647-1, partial [Araneus ventricosus]